MKVTDITPELAKKLVLSQFPSYAHLAIRSVTKQGHDNRTYRLGNEMLIRMPTTALYALKVPKEHELLPKLASRLHMRIPIPLHMGAPSDIYPYPFSIYTWLEGNSANLLRLDNAALEIIAAQLAAFLKELWNINDVTGLEPGQHNWWRGAHVSVYDEGARTQIAHLTDNTLSNAALTLWENACATKWSQPPVWIHGDFASGNILVQNNQVSGIIDFGGMAMGDPACDLTIAWTFLQRKARDIFINAVNLDTNTWVRAKAWALWKATYVLQHIACKSSPKAQLQRKIIEEVLQ